MKHLYTVSTKKVTIISPQQLLQMCTDLCDFWYATSQENINHIVKFSTLRVMYIPHLVT